MRIGLLVARCKEPFFGKGGYSHRDIYNRRGVGVGRYISIGICREESI